MAVQWLAVTPPGGPGFAPFWATAPWKGPFRVVRLVAVDVDPSPVRLRELEHAMHLAQAELVRRLVVRDPADAVGTEAECVLKQLIVARVGVDAVLRKRGDLDRHQVGNLVADAQEPPKRNLVLRGHIGVRADE